MKQNQILKRMLGVAAFAMLSGASSVYAQSASSGAAGQSGTAESSAQAAGKSLSKGDRNIMRDLAQANLAEIETGKIALNQSRSDEVRSFAQKMIDDHQQAQKELEQLAQAKGVTLPTEPDSKHKTAAKKLSAMEGDKFDKQYMKQGGLSDHRDTHRLLQQAQKRAADPDLKALVAKLEPIVGQHLTMARDVSGARGTASGSSGSPGASGSGKAGESGTSGTSGNPGSSGSSGK